MEEDCIGQKYLRLPFVVGQNKKEAFRYIKDSIWSRIQRWNKRFLSRAGKEVLLKTGAQAIPNYTKSVFLLSVSLCEEIEHMMNSYWWGMKQNGDRGLNLWRWQRLCSSKQSGGLGFRDIHDFNIAFLAKQGWRQIMNPNALVSHIYKARYYRDCSFLEARLSMNPSYIWRSIMAA